MPSMLRQATGRVRPLAIRAYRQAQDALGRLGIEIALVPRSQRTSGFFTPPTSCQIGGLGFLYELYFGPRSDGTFVEVGAFDGETFSNSSCLASAGWRGVLVEPVPAFAAQCRELYRDNHRIEVIEAAVGGSTGCIELMVGSALSTANQDLVREYRDLDWSKRAASQMTPVQVEQVTLDQLLQLQGIDADFDVLMIDVEGHEAAVFAGFDLPRWRPRMIIVELTDTHPTLESMRLSDAELGHRIGDHGYDVVYKDSINTVFVRRDFALAALGGRAERARRLTPAS